jgi:NAD(P)-dependent dehydrogenase (short-subunit alcohol dehydrogenase family)
VTAVLGTFAPDALAGKVCVITGAGSGQGQVTALRFAEAGARLALGDVNADGLLATTELIAKVGAEPPVTVTGDISRDDGAVALVDAALAAFGRLDAVANCAGVGGYRGTVQETPAEDWNRIIAVNLGSVRAVSAAAVPHLRAAGGGAIINWSSASAFSTDLRVSSHSYAASKGAIVSLTTAMAVSLGPDRIRVNAIVPGLIDTPMVKGLVEGAARASASGRGIPIGRVGTSDDIAGCAIFLVSNAAAFITGAVVFVDGGSNNATNWSDWL